MNPVPFEVQREELEDGIRAFTVRGELDMNTAPELEDGLGEVASGEKQPGRHRPDRVRLHRLDRDRPDRSLLAAARSRRRGGGGDGQLVLCCVNTQVMRLLRITGVESSISVHEQRDAALAELSGGAA